MRIGLWTFIVCLLVHATTAFSQPSESVIQNVLSPAQWRQVDDAVDRGVRWLASRQAKDGSFPTAIGGQPAVTALSAMALMSRGHRPGVGPYGETLDQAIDYCLRCQRDEGCYVVDRTTMPTDQWNRGSHTGLYNHAITGLMLGEAYGLTDTDREDRLKDSIQRALDFARMRQMMKRPGLKPLDAYGWRYYGHLNMAGKGESDLSVTAWFIMFYRSAKNAEFDVPKQNVTQAIQFVRNCYNPREGAFFYGPYPQDRRISRGVTGAGLLCLTLAAEPDPAINAAAGRWLLDHPFSRYNRPHGPHGRFHYSAYYCSQAMFILGGKHWQQFYPVLAKTMVSHQQSIGSWEREGVRDGQFGQCYTTALAILSLTPPYQLLPIYQR